MYLIVNDGLGRRAVQLDASPFSIGRRADNRLQLSDVQVSRRHAELIRDGDRWKVRDCESRLGTFVNGNRVSAESALKPGDVIRLGQTELQLDESQTSAISAASFDFRQVNALLAGLRALGSSQVLDEVLAIVLDSTLELTGAERGFILLAENGQLKLRLARARGGTTLTVAQTSQRVPDEVFSTGVDRIVTDLLDEAYAPNHAGTVALGIRHVLCTPLKVLPFGSGGERRIGVLYLDSRERGYLQTASTLHALAAEAAVVIENARLYQEVVEKERAAQELRIAAAMQQALLPPSTYVTDRIELAAMTRPCRDVGGDIFDYARLKDGTIAFAVADVAGKGTSAALLSAVVQGLFSAEAEVADEPAAVITRVNRALCRRAAGSRFVTAFYAQLAGSGNLAYCNAGHNPPVLVTPAGVARLESGGTVLGLFEDGLYETGTSPIGAGDVVVMYSDGVTEAENAAGEEFGEDRLIACLMANRDRSAEGVVEEILQTLAVFSKGAPQRDDVTVMAVRMR